MIPEIKMIQYIILPKKPKMSSGKLVSQGCHACWLALEKQKDKKLINEWKNSGKCVIVLQVKDTEQLSNTSKYLEQWNIPHHIYHDEGLTEIPAFTPTALATGVLTEKQFWMLGTLKLFK